MNFVLLRRFVPASVTFALLLLIALLAGCTPLDFTMSYQGRLLDTSGNPVADGDYEVRYNLYQSDPSATSRPVYTETKTIAVKNGLFNSEIGVTEPISPELFAQPLFLQVTINGETLSPTQRLRGAPYALSLASGAVVQGQVPVEREFLGYTELGSALHVFNTDAEPDGGNGLVVANAAAAAGPDRDEVAALRVIAGGGVERPDPADTTGSYAAIIESKRYIGLHVTPGDGFQAAVFDGDIDVSGNCNGCALAYVARNDGSTTISPGDLVAAAGVTVDPGLQQPVLLVRRAATADDAIIGVATGAMSRSAGETGEGIKTGRFIPRDGPAAAGEYLAVVVEGLARVRVSGAARVTAGDRLAPTHDGASADASLTTSAARALSAPDENGLVWAMIDGH